MSDKPNIIIAIDGYSSCGKSTLAKDLAIHLAYKYLDSGAMYRVVTLYCLDHDIDVHQPKEVMDILDQVDITFEVINGKNHTFLNGKNVENSIRSLRVSSLVSEVSAIPAVRNKLVSIQNKLGKEKGIVMDGRDITTVVFPQAEVKFFVTAQVDIRAERRFLELKGKGKNISLDKVKENLAHRDHIDTTRAHSPLVQHPEAYVIDNSFLNRKEQLDVALNYIDFVIKRL